MKFSTHKESKNNAKSVKFSDVVTITMRHWPWIVVSVMVCLILAIFYTLHKQPTYERNAAIIIKDDTQSGGGFSSQIAMLSGMNIGSGFNIRDEVNKLQSPDLMKEVVRRLDLNNTYMMPYKFRNKVMYKDSLPIRVMFEKMGRNDVVSMTVNVSGNGDIKITDLSKNGEELKMTAKGPLHFDVPVKTGLGDMVIAKGPHYKKGLPYTVYYSHIPVYKAASDYSSKIDISLQDIYANTIEMRITDQDMQRAEDVINEVVNVYNENWIESHNEVAQATTKFINERLVTLEKELSGIDKNISDYQSMSRKPNNDQSTALAINEEQTARLQLQALINRLQIIEYMKQYLTNPANDNSVIPANIGIENPAIESQIEKYNNKLMGRNRLAQNSSENHPIIINLDNELAGLRNAIVQSVNNEITSLRTSINTKEKQQAENNRKLAEAPGQATHLLGIGRQQQVKENLYLYLLQKREENELNRAFTAYNTEFIAKPYGENLPIAPRRVIICAAAFLFGLILPFAITFIKELINTKVRGRKDLENIDLPILAEIPNVKRTKKELKQIKYDGRSTEMVVESGNRNVVNDAFRVLRTNLNFLTSKEVKETNHGTTIMVTSMQAGSGKSFITVNTALSLALQNKRVLIVDGDLRHGMTSKSVGSPQVGITNYLNGDTNNWSGCIVTDNPGRGVDTLPVGKFPPNPSELLESDRFRQLIEELNKEYDYVLIDCPPVMAMADAKIINRVSNRCLFVVRVGLFELEQIKDLEKMYHNKEYNNISIVINGISNEGSVKSALADGYHND